jgi:sulfatase maturation enzyme AslB (radical SAM superfamily)
VLPVTQSEPFEGLTDTIENGYFVFTLMPSLYCPYNCKHCYLSKEQRSDKTLMSLDDFRMVCRKIHTYFEEQQPPRRTIIAYNYGGEPTAAGPEYFLAYSRIMDEELPASAGYEVRHVMLTSMLGVDLDVWAPIWHEHCNGYVQTSYDGDMRSSNYVRKWEAKVREAVGRGLKVATISVVNSALLEQGASRTLDLLAELGVEETGWLPFMLNEQNDRPGQYDRFAPTMTAFNDFMIEMLNHWYRGKVQGLKMPSIGEAHFAVNRAAGSDLSNMAGQTLFLLPDGKFVLPNYRDGWKEYMHSFGNILEPETTFRDILCSRERILYMRRQSTRNNNPECRHCEFRNACLLEFAKPNKPNDECFGAKRFVAHAIARNGIEPLLSGPVTLY